MFGLVWYGVWGMVNVVWYGLVCKVWKSTVGSLALRHRQFSNLTWPEFYMALSQTNGNSRSPSISLSKHKRNIYILIQNWSVNNPGQCVKQLDTLWQILRAWNPWPSSLLPSSLSAIPHGRLLSPQGPKVNLGCPINEMFLLLLSCYHGNTYLACRQRMKGKCSHGLKMVQNNTYIKSCLQFVLLQKKRKYMIWSSSHQSLKCYSHSF